MDREEMKPVFWRGAWVWVSGDGREWGLEGKG